MHKRLKIFLWRSMAGVLPSREIMDARIGIRECLCYICGVEVENYIHLFKECHGVRALTFASYWTCHIEAL